MNCEHLTFWISGSSSANFLYQAASILELLSLMLDGFRSKEKISFDPPPLFPPLRILKAVGTLFATDSQLRNSTAVVDIVYIVGSFAVVAKNISFRVLFFLCPERRKCRLLVYRVYLLWSVENKATTGDPPIDLTLAVYKSVIRPIDIVVSA